MRISDWSSDVCSSDLVDEAGAVEPVVIAIGEFGRRVEAAEFGALGYDVDRAADDIAPEQRALRPLEHFDPFDVEGIEGDRRGAPELGFVEEHRGARIPGGPLVGRSDPAHREARPARGTGIGPEAGERKSTRLN